MGLVEMVHQTTWRPFCGPIFAFLEILPSARSRLGTESLPRRLDWERVRIACTHYHSARGSSDAGRLFPEILR